MTLQSSANFKILMRLIALMLDRLQGEQMNQVM